MKIIRVAPSFCAQCGEELTFSDYIVSTPEMETIVTRRTTRMRHGLSPRCEFSLKECFVPFTIEERDTL